MSANSFVASACCLPSRDRPNALMSAHLRCCRFWQPAGATHKLNVAHPRKWNNAAKIEEAVRRPAIMRFSPTGVGVFSGIDLAPHRFARIVIPLVRAPQCEVHRVFHIVLPTDVLGH